MPTIVSYWFMDCKLIHAHHMTIIYISNNDLKNTIGLDMYYTYRFFILVNVFIYTYIYICTYSYNIYILYIYIFIYIHSVVNFKYRSLVPFLVIIQMALAVKIRNLFWTQGLTFPETKHENKEYSIFAPVLSCLLPKTHTNIWRNCTRTTLQKPSLHLDCSRSFRRHALPHNAKGGD